MCIDKKAFVAIIDAFKAGKDGKAIFDANDGCDSACFEGTLVRLIDTFKGPDTTPYEAFEARARNGTTLYITVSTPQEISDAEFDEMKSAACVPQ